MDPNRDTETEYTFELSEAETDDEPTSVDDFMRELEAKEKDLHITADTTFIELAADFAEDEIPEFMRSALQSQKQQAVTPAVSGDNPRVKQLEGELAALKSKVAGLEDERGELYKNSQRRLKDFETFKARTERERSETFQRQLSNLATQMLPALDNLDRALQCASDMSEEKQAEFAQFFDGIVLVNQQVHEVLAGMGIVPIASVGTEFNPVFHEAVAIDEESDTQPNTITAELLRGFRIGDHVIRHSMVKVAKGNAQARRVDPVEVQEAKAPDAADQQAAEDDLSIERNGEIVDQGEGGQ